jgi:hypothetical protein
MGRLTLRPHGCDYAPIMLLPGMLLAIPSTFNVISNN